MYKKVNVVMLPTDKAENSLILRNNGNNPLRHLKSYLTQDYLKHINSTSHHLYILSDDIIEEGDCYMWLDNKTMCEAKHELVTLNAHVKNNQVKKIIATTNLSLKYIIFNPNDFDSKYNSPQISEDFIQQYITKYNNGNIITEAYAKYNYTINKSLGHFHQIRNYNVFLNDNKVVLSLTKKDTTVDKILVFNGNQPCLEIAGNTGINRDRDPDNGWGELKCTIISSAKEVKLTSELKQILLEDLAYTYGQDSKRFTEKLKEFKLI